MKRNVKLPLALVVLVALASGFAMHAAAGTPDHVGLAGQAAADPLPFKGTLDGRHISRTPLDPPFVFDRFEAEGQATQLGQFELVIEATVNFGARPVTGAGTYTFTAANGDQLVADHTGVLDARRTRQRVDHRARHHRPQPLDGPIRRRRRDVHRRTTRRRRHRRRRTDRRHF